MEEEAWATLECCRSVQGVCGVAMLLEAGRTKGLLSGPGRMPIGFLSCCGMEIGEGNAVGGEQPWEGDVVVLP